MSSIVINGDTSGAVTLAAPLVAGTNTITLPAQTGTLETLGVGTAVASTSGTAIDFTGIPSWAKRITVMFNGVSTNGTSSYQVQIGNGSVITTGYASGAYNGGGGTATTGFLIAAGAATLIFSGTMTLLNVSSNIWVSASTLVRTNDGVASIGSGSITLSGTLDRVRITTVNGTDTFDAGSINIMYEG